MAEKLTNIHHIWLTGVVFPWSELFQSSCQSAETVATYVDTTLLILIITVTLLTRMHSSRMRTGHSLTVCWSLLPGGGGSGPGGCLVWGESAPRGVWSGGGQLPGGVCSGRVCSQGGLVQRGWGLVPGGPGLGGISQHALRQTPCGQTHACENITLAQLRCGR